MKHLDLHKAQNTQSGHCNSCVKCCFCGGCGVGGGSDCSITKTFCIIFTKHKVNKCAWLISLIVVCTISKITGHIMMSIIESTVKVDQITN